MRAIEIIAGIALWSLIGVLLVRRLFNAIDPQEPPRARKHLFSKARA